MFVMSFSNPIKPTTFKTIVMIIIAFTIDPDRSRAHPKQSVILNVGHNFQMICKSPNPNSSVVWRKNSYITTTSSCGGGCDRSVGTITVVRAISPFVDTKGLSRVRLRHDGIGNYSLKIINLTSDDSGDYTCLSVNSPVDYNHLDNCDNNNDDNCLLLKPLFEIALRVLVPPSIVSEETSSGDKQVRVGSLVSLRCRATGWPIPVVYWKRQDEAKLPLGMFSYPFSVLEFVASPEYDGLYQCNAWNGVGSKASKLVRVSTLDKEKKIEED